MIHREGRNTLLIVIFLVIPVILISINYPTFWTGLIFGIWIVILLFLINFFRMPGKRITPEGTNLILAPADGKIVVVEKIGSSQYWEDERIQVSIFMSPLNVHVNWSPIAGIITQSKHYKGKYLVAFHPKSSHLNEQTTTIIQADNGIIVVMKQIAGAMARRIVNYTKEGQKVKSGEEIGFIKFGSRVDLLLPISSEIQVKIGQHVRGRETIIAYLPDQKL